MIVLLLVSMSFRHGQAAELVMFESAICEWCEVWHEELGAVYAKTAEGRLAPLRQVDIFEPIPEDLKPLKGVRYTPTFVLMDQGSEIGRILGYPGESFFFEHLQKLLAKMAPSHACTSGVGTNLKETGKC